MQSPVGTGEPKKNRGVREGSKTPGALVPTGLGPSQEKLGILTVRD